MEAVKDCDPRADDAACDGGGEVRSLGTAFPEFFAALAAPFYDDEVRFKPGKGYAAPFISARNVMNRLDEVCGPENWKAEYESSGESGLVCRLALRLPDGRWHAKEDEGGAAGMSDVGDNEKSRRSDALKRAAVLWGIGRYLYNSRVPAYAVHRWFPLFQDGLVPAPSEREIKEYGYYHPRPGTDGWRALLKDFPDVGEAPTPAAARPDDATAVSRWLDSYVEDRNRTWQTKGSGGPPLLDATFLASLVAAAAEDGLLKDDVPGDDDQAGLLAALVAAFQKDEDRVRALADDLAKVRWRSRVQTAVTPA